MNASLIGRVLGLLIVATGGSMILPLLVALLRGDEDWIIFALCSSLAMTLGGALQFSLPGMRSPSRGSGRRKNPELGPRDGFLIVAMGWATVGAIGAMPFWLGGSIPSFTDAYFESMSAFTTTGASILGSVESLGWGAALWRCQMQWLGGMGIVVLSLAILPILGIGGMQLFKAEAPGPSPDRLTPRIKETARLLWGVYLAFTLAEFLILNLCGMGWFDALCHSFTTMATGGFSTRDLSVGHFDSALIDGVIIAFMFIAGANYSLHYAALRGRLGGYWRDSEFRLYLGVILGGIGLVFFSNFISLDYGWVENLRFSSFQVISIVTTTGFGTDDYEQWGSLAQAALIGLMFVGGCAGSTAGGMKVVRLHMLVRHASLEMRKILHPRAVYALRYNGRAVAPDILTQILGFFLLLILVTVAATLAMCAVGLDLVSAFGSVAATINNIGPGLGSVGPTDNFGAVPTPGKWILSFCMLLGRLELYTVLILLTPEFWRKR